MIHLREGKLVIDNIGREIGLSEIDAIAQHVRLRESDAFQRGVAAMREAAVAALTAGFDAGDGDLFPQGVAYGLHLVSALPDPEDTP